MNDQLRLFAGEAPAAERHPIARRTDPETSHEAAARCTESGERDRQLDTVAGLVRRYPGQTSLELAKLTGIDRHLIARRLPELQAAGRVRHGAKRRCTAGGGNALPWWPA